jgi:hypothetical protein
MEGGLGHALVGGEVGVHRDDQVLLEGGDPDVPPVAVAGSEAGDLLLRLASPLEKSSSWAGAK